MGLKVSKCGAHGVHPEHLIPQGLYPLHDVDLKRLKKYILTGRLAPCFPGQESDGDELEECPICLMHYPCLNQAVCCGKGICTECFLQVQVRNKKLPGALCPYCKANLVVVFRGPRTEVERSLARLEEQRVLQALALARLAEDAAAAQQAEQRRQLPKEQQTRAHPVKEHLPTPRKGRISAAELVQYIPHDILQSNGHADHLDVNDAMLLQALQASLADQQSSRSSHRRRSHRKISQPSSSQRVSAAWQNATERFTRSRVHPLGGPASPCQPPRELLDSMLSEGQAPSEGALVASGGADSLLLDSAANVSPSRGLADPSLPDGAASSQSDSRAHSLRTHLLRSGDWANSALSTVSSTSMEVLLSAAADFGHAIYDSGGSASPAASADTQQQAGGEQQQAQETDRALLDTSWSVRTASTLSPIAEADTEARGCAVPSSCLSTAGPAAAQAATAAPPPASRPVTPPPQPAVSSPRQLPSHDRARPQQPVPAQPCSPPARYSRAGPAESQAPSGWHLQRGCLVKGSAPASAAHENSSSASNAGLAGVAAPELLSAPPAAPSSRRGGFRSSSCSALRTPGQAGFSATLQPRSRDDQACFRKDVTIGMVFTDFLPWRSSRRQGKAPSCGQLQDANSSVAEQQQQQQQRGSPDSLSPLSSSSAAQPDERPCSTSAAAPAASGLPLSSARPQQHAADGHADTTSSSSLAGKYDVGPGGHESSSDSGSGGRNFRLSEDGGAVLLQNPDGSEALMLLVSDIKRAREDLEKKEKAAKAARDQAPPGTYEAPATEHDRAVRDAIAWADQALQRLYAGHQTTAQRSQQAPPAVPSYPEAWLEKARQQDIALTAALNRRDAEALQRTDRPHNALQCHTADRASC